MKKTVALLLTLSLAVLPLTACGSASSSGSNGEVVVYNWGEYIDPDTISMFEEETGIKVIYDEFETNEIMFPKIEAGASKYDVVCPSDYMIKKMIENDLLAEINYDNVPNAKANIGQQYWDMSKEFDPENKYSVPYCWGTVGILYNKTMVDGPVDSWSILWDEKYADNILMQDSVRDAFMVALKLNGYSMNSVNPEELNAAKESLIAQKPDSIHAFFLSVFGAHASYHQRHNNILEYVIGGNQLIILEYEADFLIPHIIQFLFRHFMNGIAIQEIFPGVRNIHTAYYIHQRGFAGTGWPQYCHKFSFFHTKAYITQDRDLLFAQHISFIDVVHADHNIFFIRFSVYSSVFFAVCLIFFFPAAHLPALSVRYEAASPRLDC